MEQNSLDLYKKLSEIYSNTLVQYKEILSSLSEIYSNTLTQYKEILSGLLEDAYKYHKHCENIRNEYRLGDQLRFNFFASISDIYYRENFHSDILKMILDPYTEEVGNSQFLTSFLELIGCNTQDFKSDVSCEREVSLNSRDSRIDILIESKRKAIIIENKINGAVDQPNQLARYIKLLEDENIEIVKIVYLTLIKGKTIDFSTYSDEYKKYIKYLTPNNPDNKLCYLAAVDTGDNTLLKFLDMCIGIAQKQEKENKNFSVFLKHYSDLLKHLGGDIIMSNFQKELIKVIYSDRNNIKALEDFKDLLKNEKLIKSLRFECIFDEIRKRIPGYAEYIGYEEWEIFKKWNDEFHISCYIEANIWYGFSPLKEEGKNKISKNIHQDLKNVLDSECFNEYSDIHKKAGKTNDGWIIREVTEFDIKDLTIEEIAEKLVKILLLLEEKCVHLYLKRE